MDADNTTYGLADYMSLVRRRAWYIATIVPTFILLAVFLAYWLTPKYRATETLLLEQSKIPQNVIKNGPGLAYVDDEINLVRSKVMSTQRLMELIKQKDPYPDMIGASPLEKAQQMIEDTELEKVDPVTLKTTDDSNAFSIHYNNPDPHRAQAFVKEIADLFISYNKITRSETAEANHEFLQAQADEVSARIRDSDEKIAKFKDKHPSLPGDEGHNQMEIDRLQRDLDSLEGKIRDDQQHEQVLRGNISQMSPSLLGLSTDGRSQLAVLKAQLADALQHYTPEHPDVKRLKAQIAILQSSNGAANAPEADNPAYIEAKSELEGTVKDLNALQSQATRVRKDLFDYENRMRLAPDVEREFADLARDHENASKQLADIQGKLSEAAITEQVETAERGKHFTVVYSALLPKTTYSPNRLGLILLGTILGIGLAVGLAAMADAADPTVRSTRDILALTSLPTLAAIPTLRNASDRRRRGLGFGAAACVLVLAIGVVGMTLIKAKSRESALVANAVAQVK